MIASPLPIVERLTLWQRFSLFSVCALAFSVSLGAAVVGVAKLLLVLAVAGQLWQDGWQGLRERCSRAPAVVAVAVLAVASFAVSGFWSEAAAGEAWPAFFRHARLLWLLPVLYVLRTPRMAYTTLGALAAGQLLVLGMSWLLWLGVPVPGVTARYAPDMGIVFTGHLEQPIMTTLLVVVLWALRTHWETGLAERLSAAQMRWLLGALTLLAVANVWGIMTGRMGYLVMLLALGLALWRAVPARWRWALGLLTVLVSLALFELSPRVHERWLEVQSDVQAYQRGDIESSQGLRLEMWRVSLQAAEQAPWLGHGVGSFAQVYRDLRGRDPQGASHPHQQYLHWLVELGVPGLVLLLTFFLTLLRAARRLAPGPAEALRSTVWIAALVCLANGPFYGVGLGEAFLLMFGALIATQTPHLSAAPRRILMLKSHSLGVGDLLRSSAAWRALHDRYPGVELHLLFLSKHAGYPTEALMAEHHLLASAHFITIREGDPGQAKARRVPLASLVRQVRALAQQIQPDLVIDFESSGLRSSWLCQQAAQAVGAHSVGIAQFPGRAWFYDLCAPSVPAYKRRHGLAEVMDYTERDFVALAALGIERQGTAIELQVTAEGQRCAHALAARLPQDHAVIGLNIGCGTPDALPRRPPLAPLAEAVHRMAQGKKAVLLLSGAPFERAVNAEFMAIYRERYGETLPMVDAAGESSLSGLTGLIGLCDLFLSSDSGPYHMAVGLRVPTVVWLMRAEPSAVHSAPWARCLQTPSPEAFAAAAEHLLASRQG